MLQTTKKALVSEYVRAVRTRTGGTRPQNALVAHNAQSSNEEESDEEDSEPASTSNDLPANTEAEDLVLLEPFSARLFPPVVDEVKIRERFRNEVEVLAKQEEGEFGGRVSYSPQRE